MDIPTPRRSRRGAEARAPSSSDAAEHIFPWPWRGLIVGLLGVVFSSIITPYGTLYLDSSQLGVDYLPITAFCLFLLLLGINAGLRLLNAGLTRADLFLAYIMMLVAAAVPTSGLMSRLLPTLVTLFYFANDQNRWAEYLWRYVPSWIGPTDREVIRMFYEGSPGGAVPWNAWFSPLATWFVPFAAIGTIILSLGTLLRLQWIERERLTFPLAQIPLALVGDDDRPTMNRSIWSNWVFWAAFAVPFLIQTINGVHYYLPGMPHIAAMDPFLQFNLRDYIQDPTLKYIYRDIYFEIHFALVGVAMLVRKEVSFSFWSFQVIFGIVMLIFHVSGIGMGEHLYTPQQTFGYRMFARFSRVGAAIVVVGLTVWSIRWMFRRLWRFALHPSEAKSEEDRLLRWPLWGIVAGASFYVIWARAAGMDIVSAVGLLAVGLIVFVVVARIVCEGGLIWCSVSLDPIFLWPFIAGATNLSPQTLTAMAYASYIPLSTRANVLPSVMDGFKIGHTIRLRARHILLGVAAALATAFVTSAAFVLLLTYHKGGNFMPPSLYRFGPQWIFDRTTSYFLNMAGPSWPAIGTIAAGMVIMAGLYFLHRRYLWWPLYPLGYLVADSAVMVHQWFSLFLGWLLRVMITRTWGVAGYRSVVPAALGVIVGDLSGVFFWFVVDALNGTTGRILTHHTSTW